jgi:lipid A 3-O-deacylase
VTDWLERRSLAAISLALAAIVISPARAADLLPAPPSPGSPPPPPVFVPVADFYDPYRYELRFGAFLHGVGGVEKGTYDLAPELVFPRLPFWQAEWWNVFVPRPHLGGLVNLEGRTSAFYAGALWSFPLPHRFFAELFVDGAVHNGDLTGSDPGHAALGCRYLFNVGSSLGYSFDPHWNLTFTFDHLSNGKHVFGTQCGGAGSNTSNPGINNYGARVGYAF